MRVTKAAISAAIRGRPGPVGAPIIFLGDQLSMPSQQRLGSDDGGDLLEEFPADCLRSGRQSTTLLIAETHSAVADLLPQNPVFLQ